MDIASFGIILQSALLIGILHGINPCEHSWLLLAPFVAGRPGPQVLVRTVAFLTGMLSACVILGVALAGISAWLPEHLHEYITLGVSVCLVLLGLVLVVRPGLLHRHAQTHSDDQAQCRHCSSHAGSYSSGSSGSPGSSDSPSSGSPTSSDSPGVTDEQMAQAIRLVRRFRHSLGLYSIPVLFFTGFITTFVPCPASTVIIAYALDSPDPIQGVSIFLLYGTGTALAVAIIIAGLHKGAKWVHTLHNPTLERLLLRIAGVLIIFTALFSLFLLDHGH